MPEKLLDPADKQADGQFQGSHRAGYGGNRLEFLINWFTSRPFASNMASGEPALLVNEILTLRKRLEQCTCDVGSSTPPGRGHSA